MKLVKPKVKRYIFEPKNEISFPGNLYYRKITLRYICFLYFVGKIFSELEDFLKQDLF